MNRWTSPAHVGVPGCVCAIEAAADGIRRATRTTLLLPGIGTIAELERAYSCGVRSVRIATHCTEADVAAHHAGRSRDVGPLR